MKALLAFGTALLTVLCLGAGTPSATGSTPGSPVVVTAQVNADQSISTVWNIPTAIFGGDVVVSTSPAADSTGELQSGNNLYYGVLQTRAGVTSFQTPPLTVQRPTTVYVQVQLNSPFFYSNPSNYHCNEGLNAVNCDSQIVQLTINPTTGGSGGSTSAQLGASENTQTVQAGGSVVYDITYGGFTSTWALDVTGLPAGATSTWPAGSGGVVAVTVTTSSQTPAGQYTLTASGTSATQTARTTVTLVVTTATPTTTTTPAPAPAPKPKPTHVASVVLRVIGKGSVVGSGINCPGTCTTTVTGKTVALHATAASGYHLAAWSGGGCPSTAYLGVLLTAKQYGTCTLAKIRYLGDSIWQWINAYTGGGVSRGANLVLEITAKFVK